MKKENENKPASTEAQPPKGQRGDKNMRQRQRHKNTDDVSRNEGFDVDHNSDPVLAKKQ
jgi:hypothetical protein